MKKIIITCILSAMSISYAQEKNKNTDIKVNADVDAGCFLTANNINFGILMMPLNDVSAQSNINVKCSKNTSLKLDIYYDFSGGIVDPSKGNYTYKSVGEGVWEGYNYTNYKIYLDGVAISSGSRDFGCRNSGVKEINILNMQTATLFGYSSTGYNDNSVDMPLCNGQVINSTTFNKIANNAMPDTGVLKGVSSGEQIIYFLEVPEDNSKKWSINNYQIISSGVEQNIPMKANIKRADNPKYRMTPDMYSSTLTVVLSY